MMLDDGPERLMQRSRGSAFASFALRSGAVGLVDLCQQGSGKAMLPRVAGPVPEVVFLNTSGGLTGGDALAYALEVGAGCRITATTQTAERAYSSLGAQAHLRVTARVGPGGRLGWPTTAASPAPENRSGWNVSDWTRPFCTTAKPPPCWPVPAPLPWWRW